MDNGRAGMPEQPPSDFERRQADYEQRVARRHRALRLAHSQPHGRIRLRALRRIYRDETTEPRPNRRPALVLALVFAVLSLALLCVAKASGGPSGINSGHPDRHQIRSVICSVFTGTRCGPAIRVATCETGGTLDPHARGSLGERGLFQIHPVHFGWLNERRLYEPRYNARAAFRLSRGGRDWSPWTCRP
jgi:hypothetical protein